MSATSGISTLIASSIKPKVEKPRLRGDSSKAEATPHASVTPSTSAHKSEQSTAVVEENNRPRRPNPAQIAYEKKMAEIDSKIANIKARMDHVRGNFSESGGNPNLPASVRAERERYIHQVRELREKLKQGQEERRKLSNEVNQLREVLKKRGADMDAQKEKLPFRNVAEIDRRVAEMEKQLETNSFKLSEERAILQEVSRLKKAKKTLQEMEAGAKGSEGVRFEVAKVKLKEVEESLDAARAELEKVNEELRRIDGVKMEAQVKAADREKQVERLKAELDAAFAERRKAYEDNKEAKRLSQVAYQKAQARKAEYARRDQIRDQIEELEEKMNKLVTSDPATVRYAECTNLEAHFTSLLGNQPKSSVESSAPKTSAPAASNGFVALKSKEERDAEFELIGAGVGKSSSAKKSSAPKNAQPTQDLSRLPISILAALADLGLTPPTDLPAVSTLLKTIAEKKATLESGRQASQAALDEKQEAIKKEIEQLRSQLTVSESKLN